MNQDLEILSRIINVLEPLVSSSDNFEAQKQLDHLKSFLEIEFRLRGFTDE